MRIAWIGSPPGTASRTGAYCAALLPHLRESAEVALFVEPGREADDARPVTELRPRQFDQVLYALADEPELAWTLRVLRLVGGTVLLEDWAVPRLARAARPAIARGGVRGSLAVMREGGLAELAAWRGRRGGPSPLEGLTLNRSVVRHGDAFLVRDEETARSIRIERNAHTPIGVLAHGEPRDEARELLAVLRRFPHARSARRPLLLAALRPPRKDETVE
jgi:hypothetical protein